MRGMEVVGAGGGIESLFIVDVSTSKHITADNSHLVLNYNTTDLVTWGQWIKPGGN